MATNPAAITRLVLKQLQQTVPEVLAPARVQIEVFQGNQTAQEIEAITQGHHTSILVTNLNETAILTKQTLCGLQETVISLVVGVLIVVKDPSMQHDVVHGGTSEFAGSPAPSLFVLMDAVKATLMHLNVPGAWGDTPLTFRDAFIPIRQPGQMMMGSCLFQVPYVMDRHFLEEPERPVLEGVDLTINDCECADDAPAPEAVGENAEAPPCSLKVAFSDPGLDASVDTT